jgi:hypothetical protein
MAGFPSAGASKQQPSEAVKGNYVVRRETVLFLTVQGASEIKVEGIEHF